MKGLSYNKKIFLEYIQYSNIYDIYLVLQSIKHKINSGIHSFEIIAFDFKEFSVTLYLAGNSNKSSKNLTVFPGLVIANNIIQNYKKKITLEFLGSWESKHRRNKICSNIPIKITIQRRICDGIPSLILLLHKQTLKCEGSSLNMLSIIADAKQFNLAMGEVFCI